MAKTPKYTELRNGVYHFSRRVPSKLKNYDRRRFARVSLNTRNEMEAAQKAEVQNKILENYWQDLVRTRRVHGEDEAWSDAVTLAKAHGFTYRALEDIADAPLSEIFERLKSAKKQGVSHRSGSAFLGGAGKPKIPLSKAIDTYFEISRHELVGKNRNFIEKWKNPKKRAFSLLIDCIGDKNLLEINRQDIIDFQSHWKDLIIGGLKSGTANKSMTHLKVMLRSLFAHKQIETDVDSLFKGIKFSQERRQRTPYEAAFVQEKILPALSGLNEDARALIHVLADTGARPNEIIGLLKEDVFLDDAVPHIWIRPNAKRTLKNQASERKIPLVGVALQGIVHLPITRYETADSASALINKYLTNHDLRPTAMHTLYSLRHTFKDRLRDIKAGDEIIDELMGHTRGKFNYGRGHTLQNKLQYMEKIAFKMQG